MKPPTRPSLGRPEMRAKTDSGAHRGKRRRPVVDPKTQEPVRKEADSMREQRPAGFGSHSEKTPADSADTPRAQDSGQSRGQDPDIYTGKTNVNTEFLDHLEEREFLRRHARRIRVATLCGIIVGIAVVCLVVFFSPLFAYHRESCVVTGAKNTDAAAICQATAAFEGTPLTRFPVARVESAVLKAVPALQNVGLKREWLHGIRLEVTERIPVATVRKNGKVVGIDRESVVLEVAPGDVAGLPRLDVDVEKLGGKTAKLVTAALSALGDMPAELRGEIESVTSQDAAQLTFAMRDGRELLWGNSKDSVEKAQVAKLLFTVQGVKVVDVSDPDRPSTR